MPRCNAVFLAILFIKVFVELSIDIPKRRGEDMMRTSRVAGTVSSINRNNTRAILSDTHFADAINSGTQDHYQDPRQQLQQHHNKKKKSLPKNRKLVQNKTRLIVKGIQFNGESVATLNHLIQCSTRANTVNKLQRRISTYRTSI